MPDSLFFPDRFYSPPPGMFFVWWDIPSATLRADGDSCSALLGLMKNPSSLFKFSFFRKLLILHYLCILNLLPWT